VWRCAIESLGIVAVPCEWFIMLALHYSCTVSACLYTLQTLTALISVASETCVRALGTYVPSCTGRLARLFFMLEAHAPQRAAGHVVVPELTSVGR
jgi:hypothetical protein